MNDARQIVQLDKTTATFEVWLDATKQRIEQLTDKVLPEASQDDVDMFRAMYDDGATVQNAVVGMLDVDGTFEGNDEDFGF